MRTYPKLGTMQFNFIGVRKNAFLENEGVFTAKSYPVILPRHLVQDIDTPEDWERAERMFKSIN